MDIIADRTMELELPGEAGSKPIRVIVGKPEASAGGDWFVPYEIHGPDTGEVVRRSAFGVDALQALGAAIHILPIELASFEQRGRLTHLGCLGIWITPGEAKGDPDEPG